MDQTVSPTEVTAFLVTKAGSPAVPPNPSDFIWSIGENIRFTLPEGLGLDVWTIEQIKKVDNFKSIDQSPVGVWGPLSFDAAAKAAPQWMIDLHNSK